MNITKFLFSAAFVAAVILFPAAGAYADDYVWIGASNDWRNVKSYLVDGKEVDHLPTRGDTIVLNKGTQAFVDDSTVGFFSGVKAVRMSQEDTTFTVTIQNDADFGCPIGDLLADGSQTNQFFVKDGPGTLTFTDSGLDYTKGAYAHNTGFHIKQGTLDLGPSAGRTINHTYKQLVVDEAATLLCLTNGRMFFKGLSGAGTIVGRNPSGCYSDFRIKDAPGEATQPPTVFSGKITGSFFYVYFFGNTWFTGTESDFTGTTYVYGRQANRPNVECGFVTIGASGVASSIGAGQTINNTSVPVYLRYLGAGGENVSRSMEIHETGYCPTTIDGGAFGSLTWSGTISPRANLCKQQRLCLSGTNASPCVLQSDALAKITSDNGEPCSFFLRKSGSGTWRIADGASENQMSGAIAVDGGTLEFESVRDGGLQCALGDATDLYEDKCDVVSNLSEVPYAVSVGGPDEEAVFSYVGTQEPYVHDRPLAVNGLARFRAPNCSTLMWDGVRGLGSGEKRLTIECAAGQTSRFANITDSKTSGGEGTLSVVKDGPGDLVLSGNLPFGGDLIAKGGGALTVRDVNGERYSYYRLVIKETASSSTLPEYAASVNTPSVTLSEFGLYDANETRLNDIAPSSAINANVAVLEPGKCAQENEELFDIASNRKVGYLFDCSTSSGYMYKLEWKGGTRYVTPDDPSSWIRAVFRMADGAKDVASFDLNYAYGMNQNHAKNGSYGMNPTAFTVDASSDGMNWEELYSTNNVVFCAPDYYFWLSSMTSAFTNSALTSANKMKPELAKHGRFPLPSATMQKAYNVLGNVRSVGAAAGTTVKYDGVTPKTVSGLRVDVATGLGTIQNFAMAANATLYVDGVEKGRDFKIPGDLSGVTGLETATWSVVVNGVPSSRYFAIVTKNGITLSRRGLAIIVR